MRRAFFLGLALAAASVVGARAEEPLSAAFGAARASVLTSTPIAFGTLPQPGETARDFTLKTLKGKMVALHDFQGKVIVLDFFGGYCVPCAKLVPHLNGWQEKYAGKGLVILGIAAIEQQSEVPGFIAKFGVAYPTLLDERVEVQGETDLYPGSRVAARYGVPYIPVLILIGRDGKVVAHSARESGGLSLAGLDEKLVEALK